MIRWAVSRPAVVWAAVATILLSGTVAFTRLSLATRTTVELPRLRVLLAWDGASADLIETYLTSPVEAAVHGVRGVKRVDSRSMENAAAVSIELQPNVDPQLARLAILERLELLRLDTLNGVSPPRVLNYVPDNLREAPLLRVTMTGPFTPGALQKIAGDVIEPRLSAVSGVAGVTTYGGAVFGASVSYDPALLRQLGVPPAALSEALAGAGVSEALGQERLGATTRAVVLKDRPGALDDLEHLPVVGRAGQMFRVGEIAEVRADDDSRGEIFRINGRPAIAFDVTRAAQADAIRTARAVRQTLDELKPALPLGVGFRIVSDDSEELGRDLRDLVIRGAIAFAFVMLVVVVATRSLRSVGLVMGTAAVSVAGTVLGLFLLKIPANMLTLAGLGMGIGVLVQNGIILVEQLRREPDTPGGRARGGQRMTAAVTGSTLTTVVVLIPFLYLQGDARAAFVPFAAAFAMGMTWSVLASLMMVPSLGAACGTAVRWPRAKRAYSRIVKWTLRWRWATLALAVAALAVATWGFVRKVPRYAFAGLGPQQRSTVSVSLSYPRGSDPESLDHALQDLEAIAVGAPGVDQVVTQVRGYSGAQVVVVYSAEGSRSALPLQMQENLTQRAVFIGGASVSVFGQGPAFSSGGGSVVAGNYRIRVKGYSYAGVTAVALDIKARLEKIARVRNVDINAGAYLASDRAIAATLVPDRHALARYQLTAHDLAQAVGREVRGLGGGLPLEIGDEEVPVTVKSTGARERSLDELAAAIVPTETGAPVKVGDLATVGEREVPGMIVREDQQYVRIVSYEFRGPVKLGDRTLTAFLANVSVPVGYRVEDATTPRYATDESEQGLWLVFGIGLTLVALAVAGVFDSVWATAMVMLVVPFAFGGVMAAFWATGAAFTREAAVGVMLVIGLAVNQCVLLVDAALERRRRRGDTAATGHAILTGADALRSAVDRSGMIVLITLTTLASLVPLAWGTPSTTLFGAIALATAGGTIAATIGAMCVMPALVMGWRTSFRPPFLQRTGAT